MGQDNETQRIQTTDRRIMLSIQFGISAVVMAVSIYVVLSRKFPDDYNKWAFGMIGLVVGYWLR